ncbi:MAG: NAD(+)/NADH kinase [Thermotogae bacterium]|nr:NAD(+)/NADH kinase [Thermotogota bacterium]
MVSCVVVIRDDLTTEEIRGYVERIDPIMKVLEVVEAGRYPRRDVRPDLYVAIGGDGTFLWAVRLADGVPVVGFKRGRIGFLATFTLAEIEDVLRRIKEGKLKPVERIRLRVDGQDALNDITVNTTAARMIEISFKVDEQRAITFRGDGLIVATPTGSTAYNLAAGGPIVLPDIPAFVITPIAPHSLSLRSIVVSSKYDIKVKVRFRHDSLPLLSADGISVRHLRNGEEVIITRGKPALLYTTTDFFSNLFRYLSHP